MRKILLFATLFGMTSLAWGQEKTQKEIIEETVKSEINKINNEKTSVATIKIKKNLT